MGLTGGIVDVGNLYDCLRGIYENRADSAILDKYNEVRSKAYLEIIDPVSSSNLRRLNTLDPDKAIELDPFFKMVKKAETDLAYSRELQTVCILPCSIISYFVLISTLHRLSEQFNMTLLNTTTRLEVVLKHKCVYNGSIMEKDTVELPDWRNSHSRGFMVMLLLKLVYC